MVLKEPLPLQEAKRLFREILAKGRVLFSTHAKQEMIADGLVSMDCFNVIRAGTVDSADFIQGNWRYRITTGRICVVCAFRDATTISVVTAWRIRR